MLQVSDGLGARADREALSHGAEAETGHLRKDEPHPVCLFSSAREFLDDPRIDRGLRVHETLEVERIASRSYFHPQSSEQACRSCRTHRNQMHTLPPNTMDSECPAERSKCLNPVLLSKSMDD